MLRGSARSDRSCACCAGSTAGRTSRSGVADVGSSGASTECSSPACTSWTRRTTAPGASGAASSSTSPPTARSSPSAGTTPASATARSRTRNRLAMCETAHRSMARGLLRAYGTGVLSDPRHRRSAAYRRSSPRGLPCPPSPRRCRRSPCPCPESRGPRSSSGPSRAAVRPVGRRPGNAGRFRWSSRATAAARTCDAARERMLGDRPGGPQPLLHLRVRVDLPAAVDEAKVTAALEEKAWRRSWQRSRTGASSRRRRHPGGRPVAAGICCPCSTRWRSWCSSLRRRDPRRGRSRSSSSRPAPRAGRPRCHGGWRSTRTCIGVGYGAGWRSDAEWIRDELGKRVALVGSGSVVHACGRRPRDAVSRRRVARPRDTLVDTSGPSARRPSSPPPCAESVNVLAAVAWRRRS